MAKFPHEFTMKKYNLIETDLNEDSYDALQDFEKYLSHLQDLKGKAGDAWTMNQEQQKKINRLSRAICLEIEYMVEEAPEEEKADTKPQEVEVVKEAPQPEAEERDASDSPFNIFGF